MVYQGAVTHNAPGAKYDVGQPTLSGDARALDVPISVATPDVVIGADGDVVVVAGVP
jgi:hypothetical protein